MGMRNATVMLLVSVALVLFAGTARAQNLTLNFFHASPNGADVIVAWEVPSEAGITDFRLWRKMNDETQYVLLDQVNPTGALTYRYQDYTVFKDEAKTISYKLQVYQNGAVFTYYTDITHNPTSVQRTWGSIKAMFR
jgi:hypothetical protein